MGNFSGFPMADYFLPFVTIVGKGEGCKERQDFDFQILMVCDLFQFFAFYSTAP